MSSTLQSMWASSENYAFHSPNELVLQVNRIFSENFPDVDLIISKLGEIKLSMREDSTAGVNVLSSEGLTFSFINEAPLGDYVLLKQKVLSTILGQSSTKVLLMIRNPIDWIVSAHAQHINEGGSTDLSDYLLDHRSGILNNLNLAATIDYWTEMGCEVVVIPMELYKQNPEHFWSVYETKLAVPSPDRRHQELDDLETNTTRYETLDIHQSINAALDILQGVVSRNEFVDKQACLQSLALARKLGTRRALAFSDEKVNATLRQTFGLANHPVQPEISLDEDFIEYLQRYFLSAIPDESYIKDYGICDAYETSLQSVAMKPETVLILKHARSG